jgi:hypothetical protein
MDRCTLRCRRSGRAAGIREQVGVTKGTTRERLSRHCNRLPEGPRAIDAMAFSGEIGLVIHQRTSLIPRFDIVRFEKRVVGTSDRWIQLPCSK